MIIGASWARDLIDIRRVESMMERYGEPFIDRIFHRCRAAEAERRARTTRRAATYAKRFAAKGGVRRRRWVPACGGVWWRDMGVVNLSPAGRPAMRLTGGASCDSTSLTPIGMTSRIDATLITDDCPLAQAS